MKIDMHCHTREGSLDGKVSIEEYIRELKKMGFGGMVISDHNTYKGYRAYVRKFGEQPEADFVVLRGLEYDTCDGGHILVFMPDGVELKILEIRGLTVGKLIEIVHKNGGILGPAHPYGEKYVSLFRTRKYCKQKKVLEQFDFVEGFNSCENKARNDAAQRMARKYNKPVIGGSDAHKKECVGLGYTWLPGKIVSTTDLISCIRDEGDGILCGGSCFGGTTRERMGMAKILWIWTFRIYSLAANLARQKKRNQEVKMLK